MHMPAEENSRRDDWTSLDAPEAAAAAIAKLETLGRSAAEVSAREHYLNLLDVRPGQAVIDVGAGTGIAALEIARRVGRSGRVVMVDPSERLGSHAREAAASAGVGDVVAWRTGRAESLPFPDGAFDRSFCHWLLLHVDDAAAVVREMRRVTRPGGRVMGVEVDWETATVHPGERTLTRRILNFSSDRHIEGWSGRRLAPLFRDCGIAEVFVEPVVTVDEGFDGLQWVRFLHQRAAMTLAAGVVGDAEASEWLDAIDRAVARRRYFFSVTQFVVWGDVS
jgi:ubiquinone/menaquinone biosynthesis C-methylase UbiE